MSQPTTPAPAMNITHDIYWKNIRATLGWDKGLEASRESRPVPQPRPFSPSEDPEHDGEGEEEQSSEDKDNDGDDEGDSPALDQMIERAGVQEDSVLESQGGLEHSAVGGWRK